MIKPFSKALKQFFRRTSLLSLEVIIMLAVFIVAIIAFISIARLVFGGRKAILDQMAFDYLSRHISTINTDIMQYLTFLGTHTFLIPANIILIIYFLIIKHSWYSIKIPVVALSSLLLMLILKLFFHRDRPSEPLLGEAEGYSFPSGHALMSVTFYGLLIYLIMHNVKHKFLKWILSAIMVILILFIGLSRVYLRYHYATDVVAGYCVGVMWLLISLWLLQKMENYISSS